MKDTNTRLVVEIPEILHKKVRMSAAEKNITIKNWIIMACIKKLEEEEGKNKEKEYE